MAKVILMCGKICSGKSTYAEHIRMKKGAVLLSVDEIMLAMFGQDAGEKHDDYVAALENFIYMKSLEMIDVGIDVIIDPGLAEKAIHFFEIPDRNEIDVWINC